MKHTLANNNQELGFEAYHAWWPATCIQSIPDFCLPTIASHSSRTELPPSRSASGRSAKFDLEAGGKRSASKNMRCELAQARPVTFSDAATALGPGSNQLGAKLVAFQHMAHLTLAISLVWVVPNAIDLKS